MKALCSHFFCSLPLKKTNTILQSVFLWPFCLPGHCCCVKVTLFSFKFLSGFNRILLWPSPFWSFPQILLEIQVTLLASAVRPVVETLVLQWARPLNPVHLLLGHRLCQMGRNVPPGGDRCLCRHRLGLLEAFRLFISVSTFPWLGYSLTARCPMF